MAVAYDLRILKLVFLLEHSHQVANGVNLRKRNGLVVVAHHFNPYRVVVALLVPAPH